MNILDGNDYYNSIYTAIIVDSNFQDDPQPSNVNRYQVYIPKIHYDYVNKYQDYMNNSNKTTHELYSVFPWAVTLSEDLTEGDEVYVGILDNENGNFVIVTSKPSSSNDNNSTTMTINGSGVLDLAMPIIISNEVGIRTTEWPDGISDSQYTSINPFDNGGWSIGLIQWHHCRAFDVLYYIASKNSDWQSGIDMSIQLFSDIAEAIRNNSTSPYRNKYQSTFHPILGTSTNRGIKTILGSDKGKTLQREYAQKDTADAISILQGEKYNIQNPAIIIFLADIMNQYGNGVNNVITGCIDKASKICKSSKDTMAQFEEFYNYWSNRTSLYKSRRSKTKGYILELDKQGKFSAENLTSLGSGVSVLGNGEYCIPFIGKFIITSAFGMRGAIKGTTHTTSNFHTGVDFGCPADTKLVACTNATVAAAGSSGSGYGTWVKLTGDDGNTIIYGHLHKAVVSKGQKVVKGQLIGYSDNTGNSSGNHLHFEIRPKSGGTGKYGSTNPLPYLGLGQYGEGQGKGVYVGG